MTIRSVVLFVLFICNFCSMNCVAQHGQYRFKHITVDEGLTHNEVISFHKDRKGFLWIGTTDGLNRFDGYTIRTFVNDVRDSLSLSDNYINSICGLPDGRLGFFTPSGLNLFDPATETFNDQLSEFYETYGIAPGMLDEIVQDHQSNFWFIHTSAGLFRHDPKTNSNLHIHHLPNDSSTIATDSITAFSHNTSGHTWIIHRNGIFEKISPDNGKVLYRNTFLQKQNKNISQEYGIKVDSDGDLWIFQSTAPAGIYFFDVSAQRFTHLDQDAKGPRLNTNIIRSVTEDNRGLIWIGTDHGGINIVDKKTFTVEYVLHHEEDEKSIGQNSVTTLYKDDDGIVWVGMFKKGVSYYHENMIRFPLYKSYPLDPRSLPFGDVNRFIEDDLGNIWIGTNGGGLIYFDRRNGTFKPYKHNPNDPSSLSNNVIVSLLIDHQKNLWIGTYYGGLNRFDGKKFHRYAHDSRNPESISDNSIWEIFEDSRARLWIGTLSGGLNLFDRKTGTFTHYKSGDVNSVQDNYISSIMEDKEGNLWVGTARGIDVLMRATGRFIHFGSEKGNPGSLSNNGVLDIRQESHGKIWVGTRNGLNLFDRETKRFKVLTTDDGLPSNTILTILEDTDGNLWMSTPNGISHLLITRSASGDMSYQFKNYDEADGLQGKQFNENAAYKTSRGELIFGGSNGFNIFKPGQLGINQRPPTVVLSDFQLFQRSIRPGEVIDGKVILPGAISEISSITLPFNKNFFTLEITGVSYFHPEKNKYRYMLEGLNTSWLAADSKSRRITFTNLDPGDYIFKVQAANNDGIWNPQATELKITILPPFWKTKTAFALYILFLIGTLYVTRKLIQQREHMKFAIQQERQEAIRMHELDMMKIKFFTNVSHEFRTPLTLILTPIEKILRQTADGDQKNQFKLIQRNAKRLLNLVNQLLDFRKMEVQEIKFNPSEGDIIQFLRETTLSFSDLSEKKNIAFSFNTAVTSLETLFDQDKLEKILFNLLSNAFKFTPEHGNVTVHVSMQEGAEKWLNIRVTDSGIGIPADKLDKIFDRFFQNELPKSIVNQGSGIGLSITKEFVRIHGGTITVESEPGKGSTFTVKLPITEVFEHAPVKSPEDSEQEEVLPVYDEAERDVSNLPVLLLVEDNEDFRFYLKDNLKFEFRIIEAKNGHEGWQQTIKNIPDLVVSDVMMPEMNGMELCRKIKGDQRVSHIPVILLTARTAEEQKIEGLQTGADDYITKPFNFEILISRIKNLIALREKFQKAFLTQHEVKASELNITSLDTMFIQNAIKCVEDNVSNADFSVEELSKLLGISRANFYKKILSLTGKSPLEFIRTIRLQHAAQLLEKSQLTVAEIAYAVGFNNPKYFARYFKDAYHELPSSYAMRKRKTTSG